MTPDLYAWEALPPANACVYRECERCARIEMSIGPVGHKPKWGPTQGTAWWKP